MSISLDLLHGPVRFEGAVDFERAEGGGIAPLRLKLEDRPLHPQELWGRAEVAAGVRLVVRTDSPALELDLHNSAEEQVHVDLVIAGRVHASQPVPRQQRGMLRFDLPEGEHDVALWLPPFGKTTVFGLAVEDGARVDVVPDDKPRWVTYGSSITMCRTAHSPARTWPATVARAHDLHLTCMGYGGQCHFDPLVGRTIRELPADRISLKLGINTYGQSTYTQRTWAPAVIGLILTIRDHHPATPLLVTSPIVSPQRETTLNRGELNLRIMRQTLAEIVEKLRARGDANLHYLDGLRLLGPDDDLGKYMLQDLVHPSGDGYELIGSRFAQLAFGDKGALRIAGS